MAGTQAGTGAPAAGALRANALGVAGVVFLVMAAVAPLTGMIVVASLAVALGNGGGMPVSFLLVVGVLILFAVGYAQMSRQLVNAGGFYAFVVKGLGKTGGLVAGFIAMMGYNFFVAGAIGTSGFFMQEVIGSWGLHLHWYVWGLLSMLAAFALASVGIDFSARVLGVALVLEVLILLVFDVAVVLKHGLSLQVFSPEFLFTQTLGPGLLLAATGFLGFEATSLFSEEARNPLKTIPRATYVAICAIGFLLAFSTWAVVSAVGVAQAKDVAMRHLETGDLIFSLSIEYLGPALTRMMEVLLLISLFAALLAFHNAATRYLFSLGRARILPFWLARTRPRGVPQRGLVVNALFGAAVAGLFLLFLPEVEPIHALVPSMLGFATLCILVLQTLAALSIVVYFRVKRDPRWWKTFLAPGVGFLGLLGIVTMAIVNFPLLAGSDNFLVGLLPALLLVALAGGIGWGAWLKRHRPQIYAGLATDLEKIDPTLLDDVWSVEERAAQAG